MRSFLDWIGDTWDAFWRVIKRMVMAFVGWIVRICKAIFGVWRAIGPRWFRRSLATVTIGVLIYHALTVFLAPNLTQESVHRVVYLNGGWSDEQRQTYYHTPQGTELLGLRYDWLVNLELPLSHERLASETNMRGWGFIVDPAQRPSARNPGNLPVGFSQHIDPISGEQKLDLGCAMCHTGELHYQGVALRVDGGQAMQSVPTAKRGEFITTLAAASLETYFNPWKWSRFATRMVGQDDEAEGVLRDEFWAYIKQMLGFMKGPGAPQWYPVEEGRGRTDAVGRIANVVFGYDLDVPDNYRKADAPASYPFVWDIWRFDWVQYTGFTNQAMARNVGEALGVLAPIKLVDAQGNLIRGKDFGETLVDVDGMHCVEGVLRSLEPPRWPAEVLGNIDIERARQGKELFGDRCQHCHGPHTSAPYDWPVAAKAGDNPANQIDVNWQWDMAGDISYDDKGNPVRKDWREQIWSIPWISTQTVGTDAKLANNFMDNTYDATKVLAGAPPVNAGNGLEVLLNRLVPTLYQRWSVPEQDIAEYDGMNVPFRITNRRGYKARPLHGVWATPPFLHNGSVPTIYDLLSPLRARPSTFYVGNREYDPDKLGYRSIPGPGSFKHDTRIAGNHNTGHLFTDVQMPGRIGKLLSEQERLALLEYLKVMGNPDYSDALGGDPLNWAQYPKAPVDPTLEASCKASLQQHVSQQWRHNHG
ncbi:hypothetical protein LJ739_05995 [Aestuariibacter halophilus]|uniref:Cytochrome c domain-containing protein n=1 Tax=Fluctibacter halophilus TaxID=226011 RepID=A0ABS8G5F1_9ALTE|nr:di-heme-cytochrome C peroxidase [Aestuariibacter halophilus]MCC2615785.1 hypothetical protein [Aestuariibacter halophilus]